VTATVDKSISQNYYLSVLIDWPRSFDQQYDRMEADESPEGKQRFALLVAMLQILEELQTPPEIETPTLKRVRQSRNNVVWRVSHPYTPDIALRLICWFPPDEDKVVVTLFSGDKAKMGDIFYDTVGIRSDQAISQWLKERKESQ